MNRPKNLRASLTGLVIFLAAGVLVGLLTFRTVRNVVAGWNLTALEGIVVQGSSPTQPTTAPGEPTLTPFAPDGASVPLPEPWDGAERVNVLVMGLDYRDWAAGEGAPRTDTMILLTIDPLSQTAGMLSIPRDLWANIPGFLPGKINTAYQLGEANKLPGGGPGLAMKTVETLLGVPIQYYAQIDFGAFVRFIDEIGGVKIDVPEEIKIDLIGDGQSTIKRLKPGIQVLPGEWALAYVRARNSEGSDFDRAQRQQQVIVAIRERVLSLNIIPTLVSKAPTLYQELSSGIQTNLSLDQALRLGMLALDIPDENIKKGFIGAEQVSFGKSPDGLDILKALPVQIRILRDEIFASEGGLGPTGTGDDLMPYILEEQARIAVLNGSTTSGLAGQTAEYLRSLGLNAPEEAVSDGTATLYTIIIDHTGNPYTLGYLVEMMRVFDNNVRLVYEPGNPNDIEIILGGDWAATNPMP